MQSRVYIRKRTYTKKAHIRVERSRDADLAAEDRAHIGHRQLQLKLAIRIGEVATVEVGDGYVVAIALGRRLVGELDALAAEALVHAEVLAIEEREGEVDVDAQTGRRAAPDEVDAQHLPIRNRTFVSTTLLQTGQKNGGEEHAVSIHIVST